MSKYKNIDQTDRGNKRNLDTTSDDSQDEIEIGDQKQESSDEETKVVSPLKRSRTSGANLNDLYSNPNLRTPESATSMRYGNEVLMTDLSLGDNSSNAINRPSQHIASFGNDSPKRHSTSMIINLAKQTMGNGEPDNSRQ